MPGSPWEKHTKAELKKWRNVTKGIAIEQTLHEALGLMGIEDESKPTKPTVDSLKLPPLEKPAWYHEVVTRMMESEPPKVGPQAS